MRLMQRASGKPVFVIDQHNAGGSIWPPSPHHEVDIVSVGACCETPNLHAVKSGRDQAVGQSLRSGDRADKHVRFPGGACEVRFADAHRSKELLVQSVEVGFGINFMGTMRKWLHGSAQRLCLANTSSVSGSGPIRADASLMLPVPRPARIQPLHVLPDS